MLDYRIQWLIHKIKQLEQYIINENSNENSLQCYAPHIQKTQHTLGLLQGLYDEFQDLQTLANEGFEIRDNMEDLYKKLESMAKSLYINEDNIKFLMEIRCGTGGTDAQDWAAILYKMYIKYFTIYGITYETLTTMEGEEAGLKYVILAVHDNINKYKGEMGIHRLVRISPFNAQNKRQTSFASVHLYNILDPKLLHITIKPHEIRCDTFRSSGAGGQHVNTTDSAVRMVHIPSGITVVCRNERSQHQNKAVAMEILHAKVYEWNETQTQKQHEAYEKDSISWGNHFRSYVMCPYKLVKDTRLHMETAHIDKILQGDIHEFILKYEHLNIWRV